MRGDLLNRVPGVTVSGGLYGVWLYDLDIGPIEFRYHVGLHPPRWMNASGRSRWVWCYVRAGRLSLIVWRRGTRGQP